MRKYFFPAYFRKTRAGGYSVDFPDLPGCVSAGGDLEDALSAAREALSLHLFGMLEDGERIPSASDPALIPHEDGAFISPVEGLPELAREDRRNRAVKKTLTIPFWLNEKAEAYHMNYSQLLQEALKQRLGR